MPRPKLPPIPEKPIAEHAAREAGQMVKDFMTLGRPRCSSIWIPDVFEIEWTIKKRTLVLRFTDERGPK